MRKIEDRKIIREVILGMKAPFNIADLFYLLDKNQGIKDRPLIREVLDDLCASGAVELFELEDGRWAFEVAASA